MNQMRTLLVLDVVLEEASTIAIYVAVFPAVFYIFVTFEFAKTSSDKYTQQTNTNAKL